MSQLTELIIYIANNNIPGEPCVEYIGKRYEEFTDAVDEFENNGYEIFVISFTTEPNCDILFVSKKNGENSCINMTKFKKSGESRVVKTSYDYTKKKFLEIILTRYFAILVLILFYTLNDTILYRNLLVSLLLK